MSQVEHPDSPQTPLGNQVPLKGNMDLSNLHLMVAFQAPSITNARSTGEARHLADFYLSGIDYPFLTAIATSLRFSG
jgi:hypothetical protein